jgi:DUF1009 family protein
MHVEKLALRAGRGLLPGKITTGLQRSAAEHCISVTQFAEYNALQIRWDYKKFLLEAE